MDTIDGMRAFVAVTNKQSFTAGAKVIGISTKLASKYVSQLESKLGAQLFHRTTRSVTLTETGKAYFERCVPILDQLDELEGVIQEKQSEIIGSIRITAPTAFGSKELLDALKPFQRDNPCVSVDLHLSDQRVAIIEDGFDLAIRFGGLSDSTLMARKLRDMRIVICASPDYLDNKGEPLHPEALATHDCLVHNVSMGPVSWRFKVGEELISVGVKGSFKANSPRAIAHMAAGGLGIGRCPIYVAEPFIKDGSLRILFEENEVPGFSLYAVYPPSRHLTARVRRLIDHLAQYFGPERVVSESQ
ncbi:MAG: LysR family transcriptional regulator [Gammaproteobacteria bacterium]|nr:LysR family transcriptional regulator [Gammaproteobacteria bacterium]